MYPDVLGSSSLQRVGEQPLQFVSRREPRGDLRVGDALEEKAAAASVRGGGFHGIASAQARHARLATSLLARQQRTKQRRLQIQVSRDTREQILPQSARLDRGEDIPQLLDEAVLGFGRADVGPLEVTLHTEASEGAGVGYELAYGCSPFALQ
jgi:hypothetical protein